MIGTRARGLVCISCGYFLSLYHRKHCEPGRRSVLSAATAAAFTWTALPIGDANPLIRISFYMSHQVDWQIAPSVPRMCHRASGRLLLSLASQRHCCSGRAAACAPPHHPCPLEIFRSADTGRDVIRQLFFLALYWCNIQVVFSSALSKNKRLSFPLRCGWKKGSEVLFFFFFLFVRIEGWQGKYFNCQNRGLFPFCASCY